MKRFFRGRKGDNEAPAAAPAPAPAPAANLAPAATPAGPTATSKGKPIIASSPALATSAGVSAQASSYMIPDFGFMSIKNSTGASAAIAELSKHIDILLTDWSSSGKEILCPGKPLVLPGTGLLILNLGR